jgi:hypothetical protein
VRAGGGGEATWAATASSGRRQVRAAARRAGWRRAKLRLMEPTLEVCGPE